MPAGKSADKLGSRMGVGESLEILCPVLFISSFFASAIKMQDGSELKIEYHISRSCVSRPLVHSQSTL